MKKILTTAIAVSVITCGVILTVFVDRTPKMKSDFSSWPIDVNGLIRKIGKSTDRTIEIQEEFAPGSSGGAPYGCSLLVHRRSDDHGLNPLFAAASAITQALEEKGYRVISTEATSCKTDYRFAYVGNSTHGSITLKALGEKEGVQLIIFLLGDIPNDNMKKAEQ